MFVRVCLRLSIVFRKEKIGEAKKYDIGYCYLEILFVQFFFV